MTYNQSLLGVPHLDPALQHELEYYGLADAYYQSLQVFFLTAVVYMCVVYYYLFHYFYFFNHRQ